MSRFDYVKYDEEANNIQAVFKDEVMRVEAIIGHLIKDPRSNALALTAHEECHMWIGKGIRNDQIERNGSAELQEEIKEERKNVSAPVITLVDDELDIMKSAHYKVYYQFGQPLVMDHESYIEETKVSGFIRGELLTKEQYALELCRIK